MLVMGREPCSISACSCTRHCAAAALALVEHHSAIAQVVQLAVGWLGNQLGACECGRCRGSSRQLLGRGVRELGGLHAATVRHAGARSGSQSEPETAVLPVTIPPLAR